jgi:hypothetical protein
LNLVNCMKIFASTLLAMGVVNSAALESSPNTLENDEQLAQTDDKFQSVIADHAPVPVFPWMV